MAVRLFEGLPGSGKSYEAFAYEILPALQSGRLVVSNIMLNMENLRSYNPNLEKFYVYLPTDGVMTRRFNQIDDYTTHQSWRHPVSGQSPLYVIDEAHKSVPSGNQNTPKNVLEWFAEHRHSGVDVILVTQDYKKLHLHIKGVIEQRVYLQKNTMFGSRKSYRRQVYEGFGRASVKIGNLEIRKYNPAIFPLYVSYTHGANFETQWKTTTIFSDWRFVALACVAGATVFSIYQSGGSVVPEKPNIDKLKVAHPSITTLPYKPRPPAQPQHSILPSSSKPQVQEPVIPRQPFDGAAFRLSFVLSVGEKTSIHVTKRRSDGYSYQTTLSELAAEGFTHKFSEGEVFLCDLGGEPCQILSTKQLPPLPYEERLKRSRDALQLRQEYIDHVRRNYPSSPFSQSERIAQPLPSPTAIQSKTNIGTGIRNNDSSNSAKDSFRQPFSQKIGGLQ